MATTTPPKRTEPEGSAADDTRLVGKGQVMLFAAVVCCFTAWGIAADLTTPMVAGFKKIFEMSTFQASFVQFVYYGAYFCLAIPAAFLNQRFGYKAGLLSGLVLAAVGAFLFYPAANLMTFGAFLGALFCVAAGCSILETSASPYVISLGSERTSIRRLNFAQAFNPLGTIIGVTLASTFIMPVLDRPVTTTDPVAKQAVVADQLHAVMGPYLGLGVLLLVIAVVIGVVKAPQIREEFPDAGPAEGGRGELVKALFANRFYRFGVVAQFFNIAAQVCTWTYIVQYAQQAVGASLEQATQLLQVTLVVFLISRFFMTWLMGRFRATLLLAVLGCVAVLLCLFAVVSPNVAGLCAVVALSFCLSLMFPTIYGVALQGLGPATKFGAAGLVMAIVGGAIMPLVQGKVLDATSPAVSFLVTAACYGVVAAYGFFDLRSSREPVGAPAH